MLDVQEIVRQLAGKAKSEVSFGPDNEMITLSAGDVLVSWVDHDLAHIRQMAKLLHSRLVEGSAPYSVEYGGGTW
jgi:hypothetical protein